MRPDLVQDAHLLQHAKVRRAPEIDGVTAAAQLRRALHHVGVKPRRASHQASAGPATLAPEMRTPFFHAADYTDVLYICIGRVYKFSAMIIRMGHREDLLAGAMACLREKGYAHTTARDIVAASGTNLGSIGYHYGSTKALLNAAVLASVDEWGPQLGSAMAAGRPAPRSCGASSSTGPPSWPLQEYRQVWPGPSTS